MDKRGVTQSNYEFKADGSVTERRGRNEASWTWKMEGKYVVMLYDLSSYKMEIVKLAEGKLGFKNLLNIYDRGVRRVTTKRKANYEATYIYSKE